MGARGCGWSPDCSGSPAIADPADERDLEHRASWAAVCSRPLSRRFVAETGFDFTAWRQRARLMRSLEMPTTGIPVTTIALDLGYSMVSSFIHLFCQTFGVPETALTMPSDQDSWRSALVLRTHCEWLPRRRGSAGRARRSR